MNNKDAFPRHINIFSISGEHIRYTVQPQMGIDDTRNDKYPKYAFSTAEKYRNRRKNCTETYNELKNSYSNFSCHTNRKKHCGYKICRQHLSF